MGRYTVNDNRSMQCNPNNERYYLSRGCIDEDDEEEGDSGYSFDLSSWELKKDIMSNENFKKVDV